MITNLIIIYFLHIDCCWCFGVNTTTSLQRAKLIPQQRRRQQLRCSWRKIGCSTRLAAWQTQTIQTTIVISLYLPMVAQ